MTIRAIDLQRLVDLYGEPLTLVSKSFGAYDPETGSNTTSTTSVPFIGYMATYDLGEIDGTNVIRGDRRVYLGSRDSDGNAISPEVDDEVTGTGDRVSIVSVSKVMSSGVVICHICQVRE